MQALTRLLLVDDDRDIARALALALRTTYIVDIACSGEQALNRVDRQQYDAIVLDLNLPDFSGAHVCQQLRQSETTCPILILTGESDVLTKITLLDAGANDYLTKPFSLGELKARLRVLLRTAVKSRLPSRRLTVAGLVLDRQMHAVSRAGVTINLRRKEFAVLECLMEHAGSVVTRGTLTRHAWHGGEDPWTNTIDVHVKYLRDKIDRPFPFAQPVIQTVHGIGYRIEETVEPLQPLVGGYDGELST
jgi:DNA-binding response OmpR family regulator